MRADGWRERIKTALIGKEAGAEGFQPDDAMAAAGWESCAVGELRERLCEEADRRMITEPAIGHGTPEDQALAELGHDFAQAVQDDDPHEALRLLGQIEGRARWLEKNDEMV